MVVQTVEKKFTNDWMVLFLTQCGKRFKDKRGLTSHARMKHNVSKEKLYKLLEGDGSKGFWNILGGLAAGIITIIIAGKVK